MVGSGRLIKEAPPAGSNKKAAEVVSAAFGKFLRNEIPPRLSDSTKRGFCGFRENTGVLNCQEECPNEGQRPKSGAGLFDPQRPDFNSAVACFESDDHFKVIGGGGGPRIT